MIRILKPVLAFCAMLLLGNFPMAQSGAAATVSQQQFRSAVESKFRNWLDEFWKEARAAGIRRATFDEALHKVRLDWRLPGLVPPGYKPKKDKKEKRQPEFGSPGRYYSQKNINALVRIGRKQREKYANVLTAIEKKFAVPRNIVLAVWGRETAYGRVRIPYDAVRSLATLAFMSRRKAQFRPELLHALRVLQEGHVARNKMKSSWAGAMGHTQMLPGHFLKYAVDFDGDGKKDIWNSVPDALATTANHLKAHGWKWGRSWGYEANIPARLDCALEGPDQRVSIETWTKRGVTRTRKRKFSDKLKRLPASLLLPAGRYGPAFIVTENFYVIKSYNESDLYALFVGHLADRISDNKPFSGKWSDISTYTRLKVKRVQEALVRRGHDVGGADGLIGFKTRVAVGRYQAKHGLKADCWPGLQVFKHIR